MHSDNSIVAEQFDTIEQQHEADIFGMWAFLVTEVLFFGGLFAAYTVYRYLYPQVFQAASGHLDPLLGMIETGVLLGSSFTMALAVHFSKINQTKKVTWLLAATALMGAAFIVIHAYEWHHDYVEGFFPGKAFTYAGNDARQMQLFYWLYYVMTGLHAFHVLIGVVLLAVLAVMAHRRCFEGHKYITVEVSGLYWHFVDLIWIFLFPLFYLIGGGK